MLCDRSLRDVQHRRDLRKAFTVNPIEKEDVPRLLGKSREHFIDVADVLPCREHFVRRYRIGRILLREDAAEEFDASAFGANVVDDGVAGAARQIGPLISLAISRSFPQAEENIMYKIACSGATTDTAANLTFEPAVFRYIKRCDLFRFCTHRKNRIHLRHIDRVAGGANVVTYANANSLATTMI